MKLIINTPKVHSLVSYSLAIYSTPTGLVNTLQLNIRYSTKGVGNTEQSSLLVQKQIQGTQQWLFHLEGNSN